MNGGIFVVNAGGSLFVKRVAFNAHGGIDLISDNKAYPIQTVSSDETMIIGKIIGALERV